jgi:hypothetical protein
MITAKRLRGRMHQMKMKAFRVSRHQRLSYYQLLGLSYLRYSLHYNKHLYSIKHGT